MTGRSLLAALVVALVAGCAPAPSANRVTAFEIIGAWRSPAPASSCDASPVGRLDYARCGVTLMRLNADFTATVNGSFDAHGCATGSQTFAATWRLDPAPSRSAPVLTVNLSCAGMPEPGVSDCPTPEQRRSFVCRGLESELASLEVPTATMLVSPVRIEGRGFTWTR